MTTLTTSSGSKTFAVTLDLFGLQLPQKILLSEISTDINPGPGRDDVAVGTGVIVLMPAMIGIGTNVAVGNFGSWVGKCTIVGEGVMDGVSEALAVMLAVNTAVEVSTGKGASVVRDNETPEQACKKIINTIINWNLRIRCLFHAIILRTLCTHFTTT